MSAIAAIGDRLLLEGYALAGAEVVDARDAAAVRRAWADLPGDTGLVLLSPAAHAVLADELVQRPLLWVVVPG